MTCSECSGPLSKYCMISLIMRDTWDARIDFMKERTFREDQYKFFCTMDCKLDYAIKASKGGKKKWRPCNVGGNWEDPNFETMLHCNQAIHKDSFGQMMGIWDKFGLDKK